MTVEDFYWTALYDDGEAVPEVRPDGTSRGWADIDQPRLAAFCLDPSRPGLPPAVLRLHGDSRPIYFRRRTIAVDPADGAEQGRRTVTVLGFQRTVGGVCVKAFVAFFSDGSVLVSDRDDV